MARSKKKSRKEATDTPSTTAGDDNWRARDAYHTLSRAEEHKQDPKLMRAVRTHAKEQAKAALRIAKMEKSNKAV